MSRSRGIEVVLVGLLLAAALGLRLVDLDRYIASDEVRWTCRSINFLAALESGRPGDTFQVGHPGVITMWSGAAALPKAQVRDWWELARDTEGCTEMSDLDDVGMEGTYQSLAPLLFGARRGVALVTLVLLGLAYVGLRRAGAGLWPALAATGLVAFDPFVLAHSRVLHLDAVTALAGLASLTWLAAARPFSSRQRTADLVVAGALTGVAVLNKSSALLLVPFSLGVIGAGALLPGLSGFRNIRLVRAARAAVLWGVSGLATGLALWPAFLVAPLNTVKRVLAKAAAEGGVPHQGGNFFLDQPVEDPGVLFYPVAVAFRLSPAGSLAAVAALAGGLWMAYRWLRGRRATPSERSAGVASNAARPDETGPDETSPDAASPDAARDGSFAVPILVAWSLVFLAALTLGPKKFDRYALPGLVTLEAAGGLALVVGVGGLARRRLRGSGAAQRTLRVVGSTLPPGVALAVALMALQAVAAGSSLPYPLAYYNPLLGGAEAARHVLLVGWGEGYDLAADWLNAKPNPERLEVSVSGVSNFAPLFAGRTRSAPGYRAGRTDYAVLYISKVQRRRHANYLETFHEEPDAEPEYVGQIAGIPFVWVYGNPTVAPLRAWLADRLRPGDMIVADGESAFARRACRPGTGHGAEATPATELPIICPPDDGASDRGWADTAWRDASGPYPLVRTWGHWTPEDFAAEIEAVFPRDWRRAWVVRYPEHDPAAAGDALAAAMGPGETELLLDGQIEVTRFERPAGSEGAAGR